MSNSTQGIATLTSSEIARLSGIYHSSGASVLASVMKVANNALGQAPEPFSQVVTSGSAVQGGQKANTGPVSHQSDNAYALALAYNITGDSHYLAQAKNYILSWAKTNIASGDPIADAALLNLFKAYDLVRTQFSSSDRTVVDTWMHHIGDALIATQEANVLKGSTMAGNNHHSWQLLEVGTIGAVLGDSAFMHYVTDQSGFLDHIGNNLRTISGEPAYLGVDYDERHAYHYVAYNMEALGKLAILVDRLGELSGNPYGINYDPFTVEVNGASIHHTMDALLPFATGEMQSLNEFSGSTNSNDAVRIANGSLSSVFSPTDALGALEAADYFSHTFHDSVTGHDYSMATVVDGILNGEGTTPASLTLPTDSFVYNSVSSPHYNTPSTPAAIMGTDSANTLNGTDLDDIIYGLKGNDKLRGNAGNDLLDGGDGSDTISGSTGDDHMHGGAGNDKFYFNTNTGHDVIDDFHHGGDDIYISRLIYSSTSKVMSNITYDSTGATLHLEHGNTIALLGVSDHALTTSDIHLF